ncbi:sugar transferase [Vibrio sp. 10N.261.46.A3]|uniref:sugar transferase n=1 Tax=Vibrio sp. 10N.261.46.A3 TaxID=3229658 RepID=UPI00355188D8
MKLYTIQHSLALLSIQLIITSWCLFTYSHLPNTVLNSMVLVIFVFLLTTYTLPSKNRLFLNKQHELIITLLSSYGISALFIILVRIDYSRPALIIGAALTFIWIIIYYRLHKKQNITLYSLTGSVDNVDSRYKNITVYQYQKDISLHQIKKSSDGLVTNLHEIYSTDTVQLLADCALAQIPVYHSEVITERLNRQVSTTHLSETTLQSIIPNSRYLKIKSALEVALILLFLPITILLCSIISALLYIQDPGKVIYTQTRVGKNGTNFTLYKFRTMYNSTSIKNAKFATKEKHRIHSIGALLRKFRLDEIPQLLNVLKGEMSLIGPRPEQPIFVEIYKQQIPFYNYRHTVKPGITGWAQINQGYTDNSESTQTKLGYDLYYIKHYSFELDLTIAIKTVRTLLTTDGSA